MHDGGGRRPLPAPAQAHSAAGRQPGRRHRAGPGRLPAPRWLVALLAPLLLLSACGDSDDGDGAAGSGPDASPTTSATVGPSVAGSAEGFPVTIEHAFGETTITGEPERVVTWGWGSADAAIALGVVPVAIPFQPYGGDDEGVLPWIRQALDEQGAEVPDVLPNAEAPPFEAIAAARPDLILAPYSGISDTEYELLAQIAPTVAYPDQPWSTPWPEVIRIVGQALGRADAAEDLLADIEARVAEQAAAHPELDGRTVAQVWPTGDAFYVYKPADPRVQFSTDLGLTSAPSVDALATDEATFFFTLSQERLAELTSDLLVLYADTPEQAEAFLSSPPAQLMDQVRRGAVARITGAEFVAAVSPPTALSLLWALDEYATTLGQVMAEAGG